VAGALDGVRVVEVGSLVGSAYATKMLADLGADVVKVERPRGRAARHRGPFLGGAASGAERPLPLSEHHGREASP
jgi:crotonobetainyl-CoA:carnitine CoA-transferase CaiB-like acyl-CoA transferase